MTVFPDVSDGVFTGWELALGWYVFPRGALTGIVSPEFRAGVLLVVELSCCFISLRESGLSELLSLEEERSDLFEALSETVGVGGVYFRGSGAGLLGW